MRPDNPLSAKRDGLRKRQFAFFLMKRFIWVSASLWGTLVAKNVQA